ncbi:MULTISPECIES: hypothetical protein [unclassified Curtobacterium]|uniref:hypothetical protein n=1 Tax=unclassified Curtobacterium TaxID=257496 RepID=UPI0008DC99CF|nr:MULTISPECIES: hypothetical protein [unclassified Curtobacterium]OIH98662.1 hypothetical protein BIU92_13085 [Curtobacterium sp. MCBA15_003]OII14931.1 hypothetical protein BIU97_15580 [Curtobacterium sp. MCBA15_009]OII32386.1 hypothetical protein BIU94_03415 [Curtobacterium sp. MMLR14_006]
MPTDGPDAHRAPAPAPDADRSLAPDADRPLAPDDLDRAFGPDTGSTATRSGHRVRTAVLIGGGTVVVAGVIVLVLGTIVGSVQTGIGGVFPRPGTALDRFVSDARDLPGVTDVQRHRAEKTAFASYEVSATVTADPSLEPAARAELVRALSRATDEASGNGVHVVAIADLGVQQVGVTEHADTAARRLQLADTLDRIGGVTAVRCSWGRGAQSSDDAEDQAVVVETPGRGRAVPPIVARVTEETQRVFPGASVQVLPAG